MAAELYFLVIFGPGLAALITGFWLSSSPTRARSVRILGVSSVLAGLASWIGLWSLFSDLCWDEGGFCGYPALPLLWAAWLAPIAVLLVVAGWRVTTAIRRRQFSRD